MVPRPAEAAPGSLSIWGYYVEAKGKPPWALDPNLACACRWVARSVPGCSSLCSSSRLAGVATCPCSFSGTEGRSCFLGV